MVSDQVVVRSKKFNSDQGYLWMSDGKGSYTVEKNDTKNQGTEITLSIKDAESEFLDNFRIEEIVKKYSDFVPIPIYVSGSEDKKEEEKTQINSAEAIWLKDKTKIKDEEYKEFYKHVAHDYEDPIDWSHNRVEGTNEYTSLLYIPARAPFDLYDRETRNGIKLYVQRVFILEDTEQLMPRYLRFVRGLIDSNNLPLNVSREILQGSKVIDSIRTGSVKKVLGMLEKVAKNDPEKYQKFWTEFGKALKEGPAEDTSNRERVAKLLRFSTTHSDSEDETVSFDDYISRMQEGQEKIYFIAADSYSAAKNSPHLEIFKKKKIEVLILGDRVDEWMVSYLPEFEGKKLQSIAKGDLDLGKLEEDSEKEEKKKIEEKAKTLVENMQKSLGDKVKEVKVTHRLTDSPSCLVVGENDISGNLERILKAAGQDTPNVKPVLEINPTHSLIKKLESFKSSDDFDRYTSVIFDQAVLAEGGQLNDPVNYVKNINELLTKA